MVKWIIVAILLLPVAEIATFILVATLIGLGWALALMLATTLAGVLVMRRAGRGRLAQFRVAVADSDVTGIEANTGGFLTVLAGVLLFLPGFITDLVGALLLIGPLRRWCGGRFRRVVHARSGRRDAVVDLAPGEWRQVPDPELENKREKPHRD
jgi:UPF0716 protein FxsA